MITVFFFFFTKTNIRQFFTLNVLRKDHLVLTSVNVKMMKGTHKQTHRHTFIVNPLTEVLTLYVSHTNNSSLN